MSSRPETAETRGRAMLDLARHAVEEVVLHQHLPASIPNSGIFAERRGVFVTLHIKGKLRGCIGVVEGNGPLGENIVQSAVSAAMHDPRFSPVRGSELGDVRIEISVLSPIFPLRADEVQVGAHGLLIICGPRRGLLLPQVATEHALNREEFLEETCRKAGLPTKAWQDSTTALFGFTCEIYSDEHARKD